MKKEKSSLLVRGFKAEAERISATLRQELGLCVHEKMCAFKLATHLGIDVHSIKSLRPHDNGRYTDWSALLMKNHKDKPVILYNPYHSEARTQSDLMHEIAHFLRKHPLPSHDTFKDIPFDLVVKNPEHEEEAKWLGATLQIPKDGMLWCLKNNMTVSQISVHFTASFSMTTMRYNTLGFSRTFNNIRY